MPKRYAREFRRAVCERLVAGEKVTHALRGVRGLRSDAPPLEAPSADRCRPERGHQELRGRRAGPGPQDHRRARGRARDHQGGGGPVQRGGARQPKRRCQVAKGLSNLGYRERVACRIAGVSRSCFYEYKYHVPCDRADPPALAQRPGRRHPQALAGHLWDVADPSRPRA